MKIKLTLLAGFTICLALVATVTFAEEATTASPIRQEIKKGVRTEIKDIKASSTEERKQLQDELRKKAEEARAEFAQKREEARKEIEKDRNEFRAQITEKKAEIKKLITTKREELASKLKVIKDEKKQQIALNIGDQFQQINAKVLANLTNIITKEEIILQKISSRVDILSIQNSDVTSLKDALSSANAALATARAAIVSQTAKVYTIAVKTEATLKNDTSTTKQLLEKDLNGVRDVVKALHESVKKVAEIFEKTPGVEKMKVVEVSTSTASSTNQ
jgi:hypothetical protein